MNSDEMIKLAGEMLNENYDAALDLYRQAAAAGNVAAMIELMRHYAADEFHEGAEKMAERIIKVADSYRAENNFAKAIELYEEVAAQDYEIAFQRLEELAQEKSLAESGDALALFKIGDYFSRQKNDAEAFKWHMKAAELGAPYAMSEIATMYMQGASVEQNDSEGVKWLKRAAKLKNPAAMSMLARMYELRIGVEQDISKALKWYIDAANAGETHARERLNTLFNERR